MIFQTDGAIDKIASGQKVQTRRLVLPGEACRRTPEFGKVGEIEAVIRPSGKPGYRREKFAIGHDYAVQPGRGKPGVWWDGTNDLRLYDRLTVECRYASGRAKPLRIRITAIRREDVRNIENDDVRAEGYSHARDFLHAWAAIHDPALEHHSWGEKRLMERPADRYDAWALTFEVVKHNFESTSAVLRTSAD